MAAEKPEIPVGERPVDPESPVLSTQETEKPKKPVLERFSSLFDDWYYAWEVFGIVVSGLAIASICVVVAYFDNEEAPIWVAKVPGRSKPFQFTLNSLLSILSVFGSTCAMIPVTKGLGQLKYLWFMEKDRSLGDLETFDSASRGKVGSAQLMWKLRFKHLAVLGGLASLLALAYGPFVQNLIVINIEYRNGSQDALLSYSSAYSTFYGTGPDDQVIDRAMGFAIDTALRDSSAEWTVPPNLCKTGSCQWPVYYTAAVCSRCTDISHLLKRDCKPVKGDEDLEGGCNVALPNGFDLKNTGAANLGIPMSKVVMAVNTTMPPLIYNYTEPLAIVQSIMGFDPKQYPTDGSKPTFIQPYSITEDSILSAHECALIPCVQKQTFSLTRDAEDSNGQPATMQESRPRLTVVDDHWDTWNGQNLLANPDSKGDIMIDFDLAIEVPNPEESVKYNPFNFGGDAYWAMMKHLNALLNGYVATGPRDGMDPTIIFKGGDDFKDPTSQFATTDWAMMSIFLNSHYGNWTGTYCNKTLATGNDLECAMRNIAAGMTNGIRIDSWQRIDNNRVTINGMMLEPMQICHAQWQYITAPIVVWLLGLVLFIGVVWKTRRAQIKAWRTSPLATLLLRLDPDSREHLKDWQNKGDAELREMAAGLRLRLQVDDNGPRFVKEDSSSPIRG